MAENEGATTPYSTGSYNNQDQARKRFIESELRGRLRQYPSDIEDRSPHYVGFYPLVRTASKTGKSLLRTLGEEAIFDTEGQNRQTGDNAELAAGVAGALAGAGAGGVLGVANMLGISGGGDTGNTAGRALGGARKLTSAAVNAVSGGIVGGLVGAGAAALANESKLIAGGGGIFLQITSMQSQYKANWESADMGALAGAIGAGNATFGGIPELAARSASNVSKVLGGTNVADIIDAGTKTVKNPYKEQLFRSMDNRRFSFDYVFAPKNAEEAEIVFGSSYSRTSESGREQAITNSGGIIQQFAFHMHPELQSSGYYFTYPSEFLIVYYHNGVENEFVRKISNAVLTDMKVEYGADGFTTFSNGMPSMATMTLTFTELEILTSQRVYQGY